MGIKKEKCRIGSKKTDEPFRFGNSFGKFDSPMKGK